MLSTVILLPLIVLMVLLISGTVVSSVEHIYVESLEFTESGTLVLTKDSDEKPESELKVNIFPRAATNQELLYSSSNDKIATVDENGVVYGEDFGEAVIQVTSAENEAISISKKVIVTDDQVHKVTFEKSVQQIYVGKSEQLSVRVEPKEALNKSIEWSSSDPSILAVAENGMITAKKSGKAEITARSVVNAEAYAVIAVECKSPVTSIDIEDRADVTLSEREASFPQVIFYPADASEEIVYTVSDETIASIDEEGNIHFKKAGKITATATVTDGIGNTFAVSKNYTCTDGYYSDISFAQDEYTFEYADNEAISLAFEGAPVGAERGIESVTFSQNGVLEYRDGKFYTVGTSEGGITVTVTAKTYDGKNLEASCTVKVLRHADTICFTNGGVLSVSNASLNLADYITVEPENHTDKLEYTVNDSEVASIENGILLFNKEGRIIVTVTAKGQNGETMAENSFTVNYQKVQAGDRILTLHETSEASVMLPDLIFGDQEGIIKVELPSEYESIVYSVSEGSDVVTVDQAGHIVPLKGGSAVITVTAEKTDGTLWERKVHIYSDRSAKDIVFSLPSDFATSRTEYPISVTVSPTDALDGKEFRLTADNGAEIEGIESEYFKKDDTTYCRITGTVVFAKAGSITVTAGLYRNGEWKEGKNVSLRSTYGKLDFDGGFALFQNGSIVSENTNYLIKNIGKSITFEIGSEFSPSDFVPSKDNIIIDASENIFGVELKQVNDTWKIILNGLQSTYGAAEEIAITVGGKTITVNVMVNALAENVKIFCGGSEQALEESEQYETLLSALTFTVRIGRKDGVPVSSQIVKWKMGEQFGEAKCENGVCQITIPITEKWDGNLVFSTGDAAVSVALNIRRIDGLEDFGLVFRYETAQGEQALAAQYDSIKSLTEQTLRFPNAMQGNVSLNVLLPATLLGTFTDEDFEKWFAIDVPAGWRVSYEGGLLSAIITPETGVASYKKDVVFNHADLINLRFIFIKSDVQRIEFVGYNMTKESVFLGDQQVRVFAKHSFYDGKLVDYYKIPLQVTDADGSGNALELLEFSLVPYKGNTPDAEKQAIIQSGRSVFVGGKTYEIKEDGSLVCTDDSSVAVTSDGENKAGITWLDPFTEPGFMRIYFGGFDGLDEDDIRNDNFGDFGEDLDERTAKESETAGTFLKITASDGVKDGSVMEYYNFNVVNDADGVELVNIVDEAGYLNYKNVVLQTSLYHEAELSEQDKQDGTKVILSSKDSSKLQKNLTYGNGFSVNFGAFNEGKESSQGNGGTQVAQGRVYNAVLKGTTAAAGASKSNFNLYFTGSHFYYTEIQACFKGVNISGSNPTYIKNCSFLYHKDASVFMWKDGTAYIENVFIVDGGDVAMEYSTGIMKIKGFVDGINFKNKDDLKAVADSLGSDFLAQMAVSIITQLLENKYPDYIYHDQMNELYINVVAANIKTDKSYEMRGMDFYDADTDSYITMKPTAGEAQTNTQTGLSMLYESILSIAEIGLYTYENQGTDSFIRYDCQYKEVNGERQLNTEHIAWHRLRVKRDHSVVGANGWNIGDHSSEV